MPLGNLTTGLELPAVGSWLVGGVLSRFGTRFLHIALGALGGELDVSVLACLDAMRPLGLLFCEY